MNTTNPDECNSSSVWDRESQNYDENREDTTYRSCINACSNQIVLNKSERVIVEVGCGTGMVTIKMAQRYRDRKILAIDFSPGCLVKLREKLSKQRLENVVPLCADARYLPVKSNAADLVVCANLLQHFQPVQQATIMAQLNSILKRKKLIVCSVHQYSTFKQRAGWDKISYSFKGHKLYTFRFETSELRELFVNKGFLLLTIQGIGHAMPNWLVRLRQYRIWFLIDCLLLNRIRTFAESAHMLLATARKS
ncbi:MAG: class I SAM-dependent methyltransferase [Nitrospiraceae bacterium]